jgi:predicted O-methyltransferase YrrM
MRFAQAWHNAREIDGWLTEGQAALLYETASALSAGEAIVEIGSHHGRSTVILAGAKPRGATVVAVDPFGDPRWGGGEEALSTFKANLARRGLENEVVHPRQFGAEAGRAWRDGPVGVLFVDGAHDYPTVIADLRAWMPRLSASAVVLLHDAYPAPGVTLAAFRQFFGSREFAFSGWSRSLVLFRRAELGFSERAESGARMLARSPWLARNLAVKIAIRRGWMSALPLLRHEGTAFPILSPDGAAPRPRCGADLRWGALTS